MVQLISFVAVTVAPSALIISAAFSVAFVAFAVVVALAVVVLFFFVVVGLAVVVALTVADAAGGITTGTVSVGAFTAVALAVDGAADEVAAEAASEVTAFVVSAAIETAATYSERGKDSSAVLSITRASFLCSTYVLTAAPPPVATAAAP